MPVLLFIYTLPVIYRPKYDSSTRRVMAVAINTHTKYTGVKFIMFLIVNIEIFNIK